jgi:hypothetical protein
VARLAAHRRDLNQRLRLAFVPGAEERSRETVGRGLAFVPGAEERSRETVGRGLTDEALERVIERYPGDVTDLSRANPALRRAADSRDAPS